MADKPVLDTRKLRCIVLCEANEFSEWEAQALEHALTSGHLELAGLVERQDRSEAAKPNKWAKRWNERTYASWRAFDRFFVRPFSKAIPPRELTFDTSSVPTFQDTPKKVGKFGEALSESAIQFVRSLEPDLVIRFGYGILKGEILDIPSYGVWSFHHGDPSAYRGQPPGFWEIFHGRNHTGAILQVLSSELDAGRILHKGRFQIASQSYAQTRDYLYFGTVPWLARACADIRYNGWEAVARRYELSEANGKIYKQPNNMQVIGFAAKIALNRLKNISKYKLHRQQWNVGVAAAPIQTVAGLDGDRAQARAIRSAVWMSPKGAEFFADPFGYMTKGGRVRILFERYLWREKKGVIASSTFTDGKFSTVENELVTQNHLSYPFIMESEGTTLVLPEQSDQQLATIYELDLQDRLKEIGPLPGQGRLIDTTIVKLDGVDWAFAIKEEGVKNTHLYAYYFDELMGDWTPHPLNPIKSDITSARPGGTMFFHGGSIYRPAQDCAAHYGSAVSLCEVTELTKTNFEERIVSRVTPIDGGLYPDGLHTLSAVGDYTLIDGAKNRLVGVP
ncbi:glucosamine inositolphosphorylceramide transferase family protein [Qipengyuania atrilutea]|uniref:Formyl transferase N-terminal domain-containing protein n=1 Tax=Qipengyuania atrilutea TaxID=2744473 RepID=A0A850HA70_9SPHN|nr:formyltransferase family protein [Actirhodobacter atriluteus]NVD43969.1 hypothetical protein [Actirhodobacter atriluteus]